MEQKKLTLQIASDLHLEQHRDHGRSFIEQLDPAGVDILILAGDILSWRFATQAMQILALFAAKYRHVIYVPGNHELWGEKPGATMALLGKELMALPNVHLLNNSIFELEGQRFIGGPMWFPQWGPLADVMTHEFNDFSQIPGFRTWAPQENYKFHLYMQKNLREGDVVLTHYLPSYKSVAARYKGSPSNSFFVSEADQLIHARSPALWVHGHTHESCDYSIDKTRVVCNPFGYPFELNKKYVEKLLIPVG